MNNDRKIYNFYLNCVKDEDTIYEVPTQVFFVELKKYITYIRIYMK